MNFTPEQLTKAKAAKSAEELLALAKENGMELTEEEAAKYFADLHKEGELSDDELDNVSGGGCGEDASCDDTHYDNHLRVACWWASCDDYQECSNLYNLVPVCQYCAHYASLPREDQINNLSGYCKIK